MKHIAMVKDARKYLSIFRNLGITDLEHYTPIVTRSYITTFIVPRVGMPRFIKR